MESQKTSVELLIGSLAHDERTKWILEDYTWKAILKSALLNEKNEKIDFAKIHVEEALKAAANEYYPKDKPNFELVAERFINAYSLENIK
jgi:hypothetical protein